MAPAPGWKSPCRARQPDPPLLEDVVTTGGSSLKAVDQLRQAAMCGAGWSTIVDRQEGGSRRMTAAGLELRFALSSAHRADSQLRAGIDNG